MFIDENTTVLVQGITGRQGSYHAKVMADMGVKVVAGVTPGKGGTEYYNIPVYDTVCEAMAKHTIDVSLLLVPPALLLGAATEAIANRIGLVVIITEHVPVHDSMKIKALADRAGVKLVGPNSIGLIRPGRCKVGIMASFLYGDGGPVAIASRSGTLSHETASNLTFRGVGVSSVLGVGGDPIVGLDFVDALKYYEEDPETEAVVLLGEIGGTREEAAAEFLSGRNYPKPVFAFIAGRNAPQGKKMGHAGAIIEKGAGTARSKIELLRAAGVIVADSLGGLADQIQSRFTPARAD